MDSESLTNQFRKSLKEKGSKAREKLTAVKNKAIEVGDNTASVAGRVITPLDNLADSIAASVAPKPRSGSSESNKDPLRSPNKSSPAEEKCPVLQDNVCKKTSAQPLGTLEYFVSRQSFEIVDIGMHIGMPSRKKRLEITENEPSNITTVLPDVSDRDTLTSIAAQFDTTPSELKKINKLMNQFIFAGQKLYVPSKDYATLSATCSSPKSPKSPKDKEKEKEKEKEKDDEEKPAASPNKSPNTPDGTAAAMRQASKLPGHAARVAAGVGKEQGGEGDSKLDAECLERFIKVSVKHITDGEGVVAGTLLVTPNAVMFDPNVSDPLVLEHSADKYGMMAPIETVMSAAIYHDIAAMRLSTSTDEPVQSEVYHVSDCPNNENCSCAQTVLEEPSENEDKDKGEKKEKLNDHQKDEDQDKTLEGNSVESGLGEDITSNDNDESKTKKTPCPISIPAQASGDSESGPKSGSLIGRTLGSLGSSIGSFPASPNLSSFVDFSSGFFKGATSEESSSSEKETSVESAVKADEKPELFKSLEELIPRPAAQYEHPPLYLCLKIGKPLNKRVSEACPFESYGRKRKKPEYWFSIPRDKVDNLYAFFLHWTPDIYDSDDIDPKEKGFVVIDDDDLTETVEIVEDHFERKGSKRAKNWEDVKETRCEKKKEEKEQEEDEKMRMTRINSAVDCLMFVDEYYEPGEPGWQFVGKLPWWEIVNVTEARRRMSLAEDEMTPLPEMRCLVKNLPARTVGYPWSCVYSTDKHGFSLKSLYRSMKGIDSPILIVIKDTSNNVFGAQVSCALKVSDYFYGTGESFLFTFFPQFKKFAWSGTNQFFVKGNLESLAIGSGQGSFGLWLDGDIYHGRTHHCETYNNDLLTSQEDFVVKGLEAWSFSD
ncbi:DgyrCDS3632 [Dimorphilus gyrociliatus]|uniref:Oxidation resistance protein 1 n=1 Tax=Dimorphilus gyrociliatus TaxID=2664684 RepID=A0A7I8VIW9_9ANNE|nr:DgyrCDS3632 [Dimorphilus gyrociliatus]